MVAELYFIYLCQLTETAAHNTRERSMDVPRTWSSGGGGNPEAKGVWWGINISTSAIVVMFLHWKISVSCEHKLPRGLGMEKSKDMQGKTLAG